MPARDARLDELLGAGAGVFRASMDLLPDPISVWWAIVAQPAAGRGTAMRFSLPD